MGVQSLANHDQLGRKGNCYAVMNPPRTFANYSQKINELRLGIWSDDGILKKRKLSAIYDFIREFPMLYIEPKTRQELAEYSAMEMLLRGSEMQHTSILEEIQRCKTNALRRL